MKYKEKVVFSSYDEAIRVVNQLRCITSKYCSLGHIDNLRKDVITVRETRVFNVKSRNKFLENVIQGEFFKLDKEIQHIISYYCRLGDYLSIRNELGFIFIWYPKTLRCLKGLYNNAI